MEAIIVALISAVGVGIWPAILARRAMQDAAKTQQIVQGNGQGNVAQMLELVLNWQGAHDFIHADLERQINAEKRPDTEVGSRSSGLRG